MDNFQEKRQKHERKYELGDVVLTADFDKVFNEVDITKLSYKLYTITQIIHDTFPSHRINSLSTRYNESLLRLQKLTLEEINQVRKKVNLIQ